MPITGAAAFSPTAMAAASNAAHNGDPGRICARASSSAMQPMAALRANFAVIRREMGILMARSMDKHLRFSNVALSMIGKTDTDLNNLQKKGNNESVPAIRGQIRRI